MTAKDCTVITKEKIRVTNNGNKFKITPKKKECRCLLAQVEKQQYEQSSSIMVAELFSPPRFKVDAERRGDKGVIDVIL